MQRSFRTSTKLARKNCAPLQQRFFHSQKPAQQRVMLTGCLGQIGSELVEVLRGRYGRDNVIATDVRVTREVLEQGPFEFCK